MEGWPETHVLRAQPTPSASVTHRLESFQNGEAHSARNWSQYLVISFREVSSINRLNHDTAHLKLIYHPILQFFFFKKGQSTFTGVTSSALAKPFEGSITEKEGRPKTPGDLAKVRELGGGR